ncbi:MAG TPA: heme ABC transporter ATP-binding protein [Burkholderiaceae bacterium]|nr:heme ABC transporter ATP-binding protein [Burkholderiaceae bacterium]
MALIYQNLQFAVRGRTLLHPLSGQLLAGQVTAIVGPNGAGKSTLLNLMCGSQTATQGTVALDGQVLSTWPHGSLARRRAVLAQDNAVAFNHSVQEVVALGRYPHRLCPSWREDDIVPQAMAYAGVAGMGHRGIHHLSGGERARVHFARVLAQVWEAPEQGSRWLFLDEPTAALDLRHQTDLLQRARDWATGQGVGVVAVVHDLNLALRYADRVLVLQHGHCVADGPPARVLTPGLLASVWGVDAWRTTTPAGDIRLQWV